ncbi:MAG: NTP transferase domain-containing protein [Phycisphaerae bacterium]
MNAPPTPARVYGVLPAAGLSRRMGRPKQSLRYGDSTMAGQVARTMLATTNAVVVVTRSELITAMDLPQDERLHIAYNDDPQTQMMDSIRIGIDRLHDELSRVTGSATDVGILVIPADMPTVPVNVCHRCIGIFQNDPTRIVIAVHNGRRGHPIIFPYGLRQTLDEIEGGLNTLPKCRADLVQDVEINDPAILRDINTQEDYSRLGS